MMFFLNAVLFYHVKHCIYIGFSFDMWRKSCWSCVNVGK